MNLQLSASGTRSIWAGVLLLLAACGGPAEPGEVEPSAARDEIINGHNDTSDTAAAMLLVQYPDGSGYLCSGSIIGPHTFLTAAHCTEGWTSGAVAAVTSATNGFQAINNGEYLHVDDLQPYTGYRPNAGAQDWHDIGIAHIVEAAPPPYLPVNRYPLDRIVILGQPIREVGYGITAGTADGGSGAGTRRSVTKKDIGVRNTGELQSGAETGLTCSGDSGGPALFVTPDGLTTVVGITSRGDDGCVRNGIDTRPDPYLQWIADYMASKGDSPSCAADGRCGFGCTAPDPDCPCAPDGFCTAACTTPAADPDCPESCLFDGGTCIPPPKPPAPPPPTPAPKSGCGSVEGLTLLPLLVTALSWKRRRGPRGRGKAARH